MSKKPRITGMGALSLMAAAIGGVMPATATQATPTEQTTRTVSQTQQKTERAALPVQQSARAAYGIQMLGGRNPGLFRNYAGGPQFAPRYNQRKARRDARRVNRAVKQ